VPIVEVPKLGYIFMFEEVHLRLAEVKIYLYIIFSKYLYTYL